MKATLIGFEISTNTPVTFEELWDFLSSQPREHTFAKAARLLYLEKHGGLGYGLLLTTKSHKKACELVSKDGQLTISVTKSADNAERIDFNFIVVNLTTQKGLYLQYRGAWNIHSFGLFLDRRFTELVRKRREEAVEAANVPKSGKAAKAIKSKYAKPELETRVMVRKQKLKTLLGQLKSIKSFEFPLTTLTKQGSTFTPLGNVVTSEHHKLKFATTASKQFLIDGIINAIGLGGITTGKVRGKNANGFEESIDLVQNADVFEYFEFDDIASEQNLNLSNLRTSQIVQQMTATLNANKLLFAMKSK